MIRGQCRTSKTTNLKSTKVKNFWTTDTLENLIYCLHESTIRAKPLLVTLLQLMRLRWVKFLQLRDISVKKESSMSILVIERLLRESHGREKVLSSTALQDSSASLLSFLQWFLKRDNSSLKPEKNLKSTKVTSGHPLAMLSTTVLQSQRLQLIWTQ